MAVTSQFRPSPALGEVWLRDWQAARGRLSGARRRNSVLQSTGFHKCLGLLKKHTPKTPPARPISSKRSAFP
jgi:hypothetical protein